MAEAVIVPSVPDNDLEVDVLVKLVDPAGERDEVVLENLPAASTLVIPMRMVNEGVSSTFLRYCKDACRRREG